MSCNECGEKPKKACGAFPKAVIEIDNPEKIVLLRKVLVPASMGDESTFPPTIGKYHNVLLEYEASGGIYLYSSDGIPTKLSSDVTELQAQLNALRVRVGEEEVARADADTALSNRITSLDNSLATVAKTGSYNDLSNKPTIGNGTLTIKKNGSNIGTFTANATTNKAIDISVPTKTSDLTNDGSDGTSAYVEADELSTVATTGSYNDLTNKPTIPTVNNAILTIQKNGTNVQTFTANSSTNKTANITVPTAVSELTNDAGYATTTQLNTGLATKQNTLTAGDNIQINGNTISATDTTYTAGNAIDITNGEISADIHPADFFTAEGVVSDCGSGLSLDGTMASTLESVELKGDTFQQAYSGKNLWQIRKENQTVGQVTYTHNQDGTFSLSGDPTGGGTVKVIVPLASSGITPGQTYTIWTDHGIGWGENQVMYYIQSCKADGTWVANIATFTSGARTQTVASTDEQYIMFVLSWSANGNYTNFNNVKTQLVAGSTADSDFEPYTGGIPAPNPGYPQDIQVVTGEQTVEVTGKNLFPTVSQTSSSTGITIARNSDGTYDISGTAASEFNAISWVEDLSAFANGQAYTLSVSKQVGDLLVLVDMYNGSTWLRSFPRPSGTTLSQTAALDLTNATKIKFSLRVQSGKTVDLTNLAVQFEKGAATDYEPYHLQSYTVDLGQIELCKIGDYQDYIYKSGDDWYLHKEIEAFDLSTGTYVATTSSIRGLTNAPNIKYVPNNQTIGSAVTSGYRIRQGQGLGTAGAGWFAVDTNRVNFNTGGSTDPVGMLYYARETAANIQIENPGLVAQLSALAEAKSYNDQTNIIVSTAGDNLPATLCVEAHRKSLSGVIEAIDSACTCRKNLVVYLPKGMTTYTNNDVPIPIPEVLEAFGRGQSVFLVDDGMPENVYVVTAASALDGIWSMRADQTGINPRISDGHWHISGDGGNVWDSVEFVPDTEQDSVINLSVVFDDSSWGTPVSDYSVTNVGGGTTTVGSCDLSAAQGNAGLFVNDDTGVFVTVGEAYELIASGKRVKFNNVPVGQYLTSPHTYSPSGEDVYSGIELPVKYFMNVDGAYITDYTNSIVPLRNKGVPPLGVSIRKIDQGDTLGYEFTIQGKIPPLN